MPRGGSKPPRGYTRVPRSRGGGYESPRGVRITEYEYRNRVAKKLGWKSAYQSDKFRRSDTWKTWVIDIGKTKVDWELGEAPDVSYTGELMHDAYVVRQRDLAGLPRAPGVAMPMSDNELGRLLIATGRVSDDQWWGGGDTPK